MSDEAIITKPAEILPTKPPQTKLKTRPKGINTPRADKFTASKRMEEISGYLAEGKPRCEIIDIVRPKWGIGEKAIDVYLGKVRRAWLEANKIPHDQLMAKAQATKDAMWKDAWERRDTDQGQQWAETARKAHNDLCQLQGLMGPQMSQGGIVADNVQININVDAAGDEQRHQAIREIARD